MSPWALADHGISSQSSTAQLVPSRSQNPDRSSASRTMPSSSLSSAASSKKRRPVRV
jgi:hypothetical protein